MAGRHVATITIKADGTEVREVQKDIAKLSDGLHELDAANARELSETLASLGHTDLKQIVQTLKDVKAATNGLDDKSTLQFIQNLKSEMDEAADSGTDYVNILRRFKPELDQLANNLKAGSISQEDYNRRIAALSPVMQRALTDSRKLGGGIEDVGDKTEKAAKQFDKLKDAGQTIQNFGGRIQGLGQQLTIGVTIPIIGLGVAAIKSFADVESAVAEMSTIKPEIDTSKLFSQLNEMSTRVPQTAAQLGAGLYNIFSSINVSQQEGLILLESFAKGATAAKTDAETFGTAVLGVMNAYKLGVKDAAHISDVFFNTVNLGVVNGQELASSLGVVTQAAKNAGVSFDELGALIVGVTKEGGEASQNINNLANFLMKLPTKEAAADLRKLGVEVQDKGKFRPILDVLTELQAKLSKMSESDAAQALQKIFPDAQARTGVQTLLSQLDAVKQALEVNKTTAGAADTAYKKISATANVQFQLLKNTSVAILAELGSAILPVLQPLIIWLAQNLVPAVKEAVQSFKSWSPQMQTVAVAIAGVVAAIAPALVVIGSLIVGIGSIVSAIGALGGLAGVATVLAAITAAIGGLALSFAPTIAFAAALYLAWTTNFGNIQKFISEFVTKVKQSFDGLMVTIQPAIDAVKKYVTDGFAQIKTWWETNGKSISDAAEKTFNFILKVVQVVIDKINQLWAQHGAQITSIVQSAWNIVKVTISTAVSTIGNIIMLVTNVINGEYRAAWENFKSIIQNAGNGAISIIKSTLNIIWQLIKSIGTYLYSVGSEILTAAYDIGKNLIQGLINGIKSKISDAYDTAKSTITGVIDIFRNVPIIRSPSKVTTEIGEFLAEGLSVGMENRALRVKATAKKVIDDTIKTLKDAFLEFQKVAGMSPEAQARLNQADIYNQAKQDAEEVRKYRFQTGERTNQSLPTKPADIAAELKYFQDKAKAAQDLQKATDDSLDKLEESIKETEAYYKQYAENYVKFKDSISHNGEIESLNLQKEIDLLGVTDAMERQKIENTYAVKKLREDMAADGWGQKEIDDAAETLRLEQSRSLELHRILDVRKQIIAASDLEKDLFADLTQLQNGNRELSTYEKTLQKINLDLKDISDADKKRLLDIAATIDAQKEFNKVYEKTYSTIRDVLGILAEDSGDSIGERLKNVFKYTTDRLKENFLNKLSGTLTNIVLGVDINSSGNPILDENKKQTNYLKIVAGAVTGQSVSGSGGFIPNVSGSRSGGSGIGGLFNSILGGLFGGNNSTGGNVGILGGMGPGGLMHLTGSGAGSSITTQDAFDFVDLGGGSGFSWNSISKSLFGEKGFGWNAGTTAGLGSIAQLLGSIIGGRTGNVLSMAGTGAQIGSMFGPIGGAVGAGVGALIGLFTGGTRKQDEEARTQAKTAVLAEFDKIIASLNQHPPGINPPTDAATQADQIIAQYTQAMNGLKDSKTRRIAMDELKPGEAIGYKRNLINTAIGAAIQWQADDMNRQDTSRRLVGEFAGGVYMDKAFRAQYNDFKRYNGMMRGTYTGNDYLHALIGDGEMVLNPSQIAAVRRNAGGVDVFAGAGIPNHKATPETPKFATGVSFANSSASSGSNRKQDQVINFEPKIEIFFNGERFSDAEIESIAINGVRKFLKGGGKSPS